MNFVMRCLVPPGDVNQLTINAGIQGPACKYLPISIDTENKWSFNCSACAEPHSPHHKIHFKKGGHQPAMKTDAAKGANQHEVLRKMNSTKCNEMASLIEIVIDFND
ncbi:hypothetical protein FBG47_11890 [Escherichia coli]|nr:hypothetical protein [Escherichia coli]EFC1802946.1 hypothetical protein [Escherichia coli]